MLRRAICVLVTVMVLSVPAWAGIGRLTPETAKRIGGAPAVIAQPAGSQAGPNGPNGGAAHPHAVNGPENAGTNPDGTAANGPGSGPEGGHSNVGLFAFIAVLVLGGTAAGIFVWMRKQQA